MTDVRRVPARRTLVEVRARARSTGAGRAAAAAARQRRAPAADGSVQRVPLARLRVGDRVRVAAGQAFPGDGTLLEGDRGRRSAAERRVAACRAAAGELVVGGSINLAAPVVLRLDQVGEGTRYQQIVDLVQRALTERPAMPAGPPIGSQRRSCGRSWRSPQSRPSSGA